MLKALRRGAWRRIRQRRPLRLLVAGIVAIGLLAAGTLLYRRGFQGGLDFTAAKDSTAPRKWVSPRWGYEITFPAAWGPIQRGDASVLSPGVDLFCSNGRSASTAVFAYARTPADTLEAFAKEILDRHRQEFKNLEMVQERSYDVGGIPYKKMVFRVQSPVSKTMCHYAVILGQEVVLAVSSNALESEYRGVELDFESIVQSVRFVPKGSA